MDITKEIERFQAELDALKSNIPVEVQAQPRKKQPGPKSALSKKLSREDDQLICETFLCKHTRCKLGKVSRENLKRLCDYIRAGLIKPTSTTFAPPVMRMYDPNIEPSSRRNQVPNWDVFFSRIDAAEKRKTEADGLPQSSSESSTPLNVVDPGDDRTLVVFHGRKLWPRDYRRPGMTLEKAVAVANLLEDSERFMLASGRSYTDMQHHFGALAKWIRQIDEAAGELFHQGAMAWRDAPGECVIPRKINFADR